jgi:hypothetical protein
VDISLHSNGTRFGGKELGGLQAAIPTVTNSGTYAGIDRSRQRHLAHVRPFDANSFARISARRSARPPSDRSSTAS